MPFVSAVGEGRAVRAGQQLRVPVTFERPLPAPVPKRMTVLWTDLINCQYMGMQDVTPQGCTLVWDAPEPGRSRVKATVMLPRSEC
jgi:hypothetical protein